MQSANTQHTINRKAHEDDGSNPHGLLLFVFLLQMQANGFFPGCVLARHGKP